MRKYLAEFIGTFTLVLFGCGTAVVAGEKVGFLASWMIRGAVVVAFVVLH